MHGSRKAHQAAPRACVGERRNPTNNQPNNNNNITPPQKFYRDSVGSLGSLVTGIWAIVVLLMRYPAPCVCGRTRLKSGEFL